MKGFIEVTQVGSGLTLININQIIFVKENQLSLVDYGYMQVEQGYDELVSLITEALE